MYPPSGKLPKSGPTVGPPALQTGLKPAQTAAARAQGPSHPLARSRRWVENYLMYRRKVGTRIPQRRGLYPLFGAPCESGPTVGPPALQPSLKPAQTAAAGGHGGARVTLVATPQTVTTPTQGPPSRAPALRGAGGACRGRVLRSRGTKNFWTLRVNREVIYTEIGVLARFRAFSSWFLDPKMPCPDLYPRFLGVVSQVFQFCFWPCTHFLGVRRSTTTPYPPGQGVEKMERSGDFGPPTAPGFSSERLFVTRQ